MIILKYNQTFGLLFFFIFINPVIFLLYIYICVALCWVVFLSNITKARWICTVTSTPMERGRVQRKRVTYNQVFWSKNPSPLIRTFLWKSICSHVCVFDRTLPLGVWTVDRFDPHHPTPRQVCVFCRTPVSHSGNLFQLLGCSLSSHTSLIGFWEEASTRKKNSNWISIKPFTCLQTGVFSSFWVYRGVASDCYCLTFLRGGG